MGSDETRTSAIPGGAYIVLFSLSIVMLTLATPGAAEVEAQTGKAARVQRLHGMKNNLVVHGAAEQRMRMAQQRAVRCFG